MWKYLFIIGIFVPGVLSGQTSPPAGYMVDRPPGITMEEGRKLWKGIFDIPRLIHTRAVIQIAKDQRLLNRCELFMEVNNIKVLHIGYIESEEFWPAKGKRNQESWLISESVAAQLTGRIIFFPEVDGDKIIGYRIDLTLHGESEEVYSLLNVSGEEMEAIVEESQAEHLGEQVVEKPSHARDQVVSAMIAALDGVEEKSGVQGIDTTNLMDSTVVAADDLVIKGLSLNEDLVAINTITVGFTPGEGRVAITYSIKDTLGLNYNKLEILKLTGEDSTDVIAFFNLEKGDQIAFKDGRDGKDGWNGANSMGEQVEAGTYLVKLTVAVDDSYYHGFESYEQVVAEQPTPAEGDDIYDYFVTDEDAWYREKEAPYKTITPEPRTNILTKGSQVAVLEVVQDDKGKDVAKMRIKSTEEIEYTTLGNLTRVETMSEEIKYKLTENYTALALPYSSEKLDKTYLKDDEFTADKKCGSYFKVKGTGQQIFGHWIIASILRSEFFTRILALLKDKDEMTVSETSDIRAQIGQLGIEEERGDLYVELQAKVPYKDQRDNEAPATEADLKKHTWMTANNITTAGEIMCNLTAQAMALSYLGIDKPCSGCSDSCNTTYNQTEDYLECVRVDKEFDPRDQGSAREDLAELFDVEYEYIELRIYTKEEIIEKLTAPLRKGNSVMLGGFGHMVRLQSVSETGVTVDDPYGKMVNFTASGVTAKYKKDGKDYRNGKDFGDAVGEDNFWTWDQFMNQLKVAYGEAYSKK